MNSSDLEKLADRILERIRKRPGYEYNPDRLAKTLKAETGEILSAVTVLKRLGYKIKTDHGKSLTFVKSPDRLLEEEILFGLKTKRIGKKVFAYQSVQSTNTIAHQLALSGTPEGTIVVAERQTKGRGRMGRRWDSPERVGIYLSVVLFPDIDPKLAPGISLLTAVALAETIESAGIKGVKIKWPNDVLIDGKKTAGILTELSAEIGKTHHVIIGVGINVNSRPGDIPKEFRKQAISLKIASGKDILRVGLLQNFLVNLENEYRRFKKSGLKACRKKIIGYSSLLGKEIEVTSGSEKINGKAVDIDSEGHLVLERNGKKIALSAGEVTLH